MKSSLGAITIAHALPASPKSFAKFIKFGKKRARMLDSFIPW